MSEYEIEIIGGGKMGTAILSGFLKNKLVDASQVAVAESDITQIETLRLEYESVDVIDLPVDCKTLILAVKPNVAAEVIETLNVNNVKFERVISIMAGITTDYLSERLKHTAAIIRSMPNTPAMIGKGMIAITKGPNCAQQDLEFSTNLLSVLGDTVWVGEEEMDAITAISGSGPAYLYYLTESLVAAGIRQGLDETLAYQLSVKTMIGAAELMDRTDSSPTNLRRAVTSKGGTTQAALESFEKDDLFGLVARAVDAAAQRSRQIGSTLK